MIFVFCFALCQAPAQDISTEANRTAKVHGTVINSVTREPIGNALVFSPDNRFAMMSDSEGHFEFAFPQAGPNGGGVGPSMLSARKPGFLSDPNAETQNVPDNPADDITLVLVPEALIVGHVTLPTSEASDPIEVELFQRQVQDGRAVWSSKGTAVTRSNGEFRFSDLSAGTYKLLTHELPDADSGVPGRSGQQYAYPPVYYPAATDFSTAASIQLSAGLAFQAELSLVKQPYYQVKVPVVNLDPGVPVSVTVSVQGHKGPGYALGYNQQAITGLLPNGHYTLEASSFGPVSASGVLNIVVNGAAVEGPRMILIQDHSITVNVKEEFTSTENTTSMGGGVVGGQRSINQQRFGGYMNVMLQPADEFGEGRGGNSRSAPPKGNAIVIDNVKPGSYWVRVFSSRGFASSVTSGGTDLLHQPLVVGLGGAVPPIEVTMRDDSAQIEGIVEGADRTPNAGLAGSASAAAYLPYAFVYCVPLPDSTGQFTEIGVSPDGKFNSPPLPPGSYNVLAFRRPQSTLEYHDSEAMRAYEAKGAVVRLVAGQTEHLRLPLIASE